MKSKYQFLLFLLLLNNILKAQYQPFTQLEKIPNALSPSLSGYTGKHNVNIMNQRQGNSFQKPFYNDFLVSYDGGTTSQKKNQLRMGS